MGRRRRGGVGFAEGECQPPQRSHCFWVPDVPPASLSDPSGLHNICEIHDPTTMALLSLLVVTVFAAVLTAAAIRVFGRTEVR